MLIPFLGKSRPQLAGHIVEIPDEAMGEIRLSLGFGEVPTVVCFEGLPAEQIQHLGNP